MMTYHDEVESLQNELAVLRSQLMAGRERVRPRLDALISRTRTLTAHRSDQAGDGVLHELLERLLSYQRGFEVNDCVRAAQSSRRRRW